MTFIRPFEGEAVSEIILFPQGNAAKVTRTMDTEQDTKMKIMRPLMDCQMGKYYGESLSNPKVLVGK